MYGWELANLALQGEWNSYKFVLSVFQIWFHDLICCFIKLQKRQSKYPLQANSNHRSKILVMLHRSQFLNFSKLSYRKAKKTSVEIHDLWSRWFEHLMRRLLKINTHSVRKEKKNVYACNYFRKLFFYCVANKIIIACSCCSWLQKS